MAEIIKHGKYYGNRVTCPHCGCVFISHPEDYIVSEKRIGGRRIVICPECGREVTLYGECRPYDWMNNEDTFKIHPESDPIYNKDYYDVHIDKYDLSKNINWKPDIKLPDDITDYISRVNSIDNYKLPDDYKISDLDCMECDLKPCNFYENLECPYLKSKKEDGK